MKSKYDTDLPISRNKKSAAAMTALAVAAATGCFFSCKGRKAPAARPGAIEWVSIRGGNFMMGSNDSIAMGGASIPGPVHEVSVPEFEMSKTEVTNRQYRTCVNAGACTPPHALRGSCIVRNGSWWNRWMVSKSLRGDDHPVVCVDWNQARAFARWVGGRLPSEAEWEYAARSAGKDWKYPWGNTEANCKNAVIGADCSLGCVPCGGKATEPVCSKPSGNTEQGLCDMAGNVWEWVEDWYHGSYSGAPADASAWIHPSGSYRVARGGSWNDLASEARATNRGRIDPGYWDKNLGFRVARSAQQSGASARPIESGNSQSIGMPKIKDGQPAEPTEQGSLQPIGLSRAEIGIPGTERGIINNGSCAKGVECSEECMIYKSYVVVQRDPPYPLPTDDNVGVSDFIVKKRSKADNPAALCRWDETTAFRVIGNASPTDAFGGLKGDLLFVAAGAADPQGLSIYDLKRGAFIDRGLLHDYFAPIQPAIDGDSLVYWETGCDDGRTCPPPGAPLRPAAPLNTCETKMRMDLKTMKARATPETRCDYRP